MISQKTVKTLEYDKIAEKLSGFAVLSTSKKFVTEEKFNLNVNDVLFRLNKTKEAYELYVNGVSGVVFFDEIFDELDLAEKLYTLSPSMLLKVARLLRSSRVTQSSIVNATVKTEILYDIATRIFYDNYLENEIFSKIVNDGEVADSASSKLYEIRKSIKHINERIREKLQGYMRSGANKYLQDNVVSIRNGRYVVPVKSESVNSVKGFIHDRSASGNTFFIEPQEVLNLNNELRSEILAEQIEVEKILADLTQKVSLICNNLRENITLLTDIDVSFSKAEYSYKIKGVYPKINTNGYVDIKNGRHPLIDSEKVVPISINFGNNFNYVLISGPNTGGKTVTLKLVGLFVLMVSMGIYIPASEGTSISIFNQIFCDIGDEQSIENSLSTFSSHLNKVKHIVERANDTSLVLIDELGAGTDPDEGSAIAQAILERLLAVNSYGVVTTHYSSLKEFAFLSDKIENASMDFDSKTFKPLYKINLGTPGLSNAIEISRRLGLDVNLVERAKSLLSTDKKALDKILYQAEKSRIESENLKKELEELKRSQLEVYNNLIKEKEKFDKERQNFLLKAKTESRKLINEKAEVAEELLSKMKEIFNKNEYRERDLVDMATLKNKLLTEKYSAESKEDLTVPYKKVDVQNVNKGDLIYIKTLDSSGEVIDVNYKKGVVTALVGSIRINVKKDDIYLISTKNSKVEKATVSIKRESVFNVKTELNVIGKNLQDAILEVEKFIDTAVISNFEEVKIVHGKGQNVLSRGIQDYLKSHKAVSSIRFGKYGEGEQGVTFVKLK